MRFRNLYRFIINKVNTATLYINELRCGSHIYDISSGTICTYWINDRQRCSLMRYGDNSMELELFINSVKRASAFVTLCLPRTCVVTHIIVYYHYRPPTARKGFMYKVLNNEIQSIIYERNYLNQKIIKYQYSCNYTKDFGYTYKFIKKL